MNSGLRMVCDGCSKDVFHICIETNGDLYYICAECNNKTIKD